MNEKEHLMKRLMAERFAAIETILFLDTHPDDKAVSYTHLPWHSMPF